MFLLSNKDHFSEETPTLIWFLLYEEEFVMNLKLSSWTPSMLLETRYKILSTFIFVSSCGPRIHMARLTFIHPEFIFQSVDYRFIWIHIEGSSKDVGCFSLHIPQPRIP